MFSDSPPRSKEKTSLKTAPTWEELVANPPAHVDIRGHFSEALLKKMVSFAIADNLKTSAEKCRNCQIDVGMLFASLSRWREGEKDGKLFCQGTVVENRRSLDTMQLMSLMVADLDTGISIETVAKKIEEQGIAAAVVTSHSHNSTTSDIRVKDLKKWLKDGEEITLEVIREFMIMRGKHDASIIESVTSYEKVRTRNGYDFRVRHAPMPKARIVSILETPFSLDDFDDLDAANLQWSKAATGFGKLLGIQIDGACKDSSRAYYYPSRPKGSPEYRATYIAGKCVDFSELVELGSQDDLDEPTKGASTAPKTESKETEGPESKPRPESPPGNGNNSDASKRWAASFGSRFEAAKALRANAPDLLTTPALQGKGWHLKECPLSELHTDPGKVDSATFVCDASANDRGGFIIKCQHGGCQDVDRLDFLQRLIDDHVLPADALTDPKFLTPDPHDDLLKKVAADIPLPTYNRRKFRYVVR